MYHHISKHLKVRQKYSAARRIFNSLLGVWKCDETLSLVFHILLLSTGEALRVSTTQQRVCKQAKIAEAKFNNVSLIYFVVYLTAVQAT